MAWLGAAVSVAIVLMKVVPGVPGSFTRAEWIAFAAWSALRAGLLARPPPVETAPAPARRTSSCGSAAENLDRRRCTTVFGTPVTR